MQIDFKWSETRKKYKTGDAEFSSGRRCRQLTISTARMFIQAATVNLNRFNQTYRGTYFQKNNAILIEKYFIVNRFQII